MSLSEFNFFKNTVVELWGHKKGYIRLLICMTLCCAIIINQWVEWDFVYSKDLSPLFISSKISDALDAIMRNTFCIYFLLVICNHGRRDVAGKSYFVLTNLIGANWPMRKVQRNTTNEAKPINCVYFSCYVRRSILYDVVAKTNTE